ncbi:hypothetical protein BJF86_13190 [Serinicoccus sp. CNJ-927]|uniref:SCO6880 family protein n=1 Tax=Serinicoccus sp. CNJ-927 TaxID=1904970 RepID=UPI0009627CFA|nr:SCO6880 family protein [Serinicoccus sp. CNJ-927]OLT43909.1 hypothetical protein BJF86_13190 [Serinicoccus sp. CNJ-927]
MTIYSDYTPRRVGWFLGISGWQLGTIALTFLPVAATASAGRWASAAVLTLGWLVLVFLVVVPVRGRSATGWAWSTVRVAAGSLAGWTRFRARAATGQARDLSEVDLPGVLAGLAIHEGPPQGPEFARPALIQHRSLRTWTQTASLEHPGIDMAEAGERDLLGRGLGTLLDAAEATELIDTVILMVRSIPEDGTERAEWVRRHRTGHASPVVSGINAALDEMSTRINTRSEAFFSFVVPEARLGRAGREFGGGIDGRARVIQSAAAEMEAQLTGGLGATRATWLTSPQLAAVTRTGFAPGDRASIVEAVLAHDKDAGVNADVPWAMAGPSGADPAPRHYSHDAWNSASVTLRLPDKGAAMGALRAVLTPGLPGERRSLVVVFPVVPRGRAVRQSEKTAESANLAEDMRAKVGMRTGASIRGKADKARRVDAKLAAGNSLTYPYAVATVTAPKTARISECRRRLESSVRKAGFAPLPLDMAHDVAFASSCVPLGVDLTRPGQS